MFNVIASEQNERGNLVSLPAVSGLKAFLTMTAVLLFLLSLPAVADKTEDICAKQGDVNIGVLVKNLDTGEVIYQHHPQRSFITASVTKLFTAYSALHYLGEEYRFATTLSLDNQNVIDHSLSSSLYLKFSGDPSLTKEDLVKIIASLKDLQIKQIKGDIIIDTSAFPEHSDTRGGFSANDQIFCYAAPKGAIIVDVNCAQGLVKASKIGTLVDVTNDNKLVLRIVNGMNTVPVSNKSCPFDSKYLGQNQFELSGCMSSDMPATKLNFALPDNFKMISDYLNDILKQNQIKLEGKIKLGQASGKSVLYSHRSPPLLDLLRLVIEDSDNVYASNIFKVTGAKYSGGLASDENGVRALYNLLNDHQQIDIYEGAGESWYNIASPEAIVNMLERIYHDKTMHEHLKELLPRFSHEGTVKHRDCGNHVNQYIYAKTGTHRHTSALAGYYLPPNKPAYAFAIMINNHLASSAEIKKLEDELLTELLKFKSWSS